MSRSSSLSEYRRKRDFSRTPEPSGTKGKAGSGNRFVVQKHHATRLHWDFRLEADGVLKSWAVTKGPSADPAIKRLAVRTEDHPLSYGDFEGTIPAGEYGGGTVMLWDQGSWEPVAGKSARDIESGHLHFVLRGERMKGEWILVRLKPQAGETRENWLLRKVEDPFAEPGDTLVDRGLTSVATGRSMSEISADVKRPQKIQPTRKPRSRAIPKFRPPQLATLVDSVPPGNGWMHEIKFDGYRAMVAAGGDTIRVFTRSGQDWTEKFSPLVEALSALDLPACLMDGEIVAHDSAGNPDFSTLQKVLKRGHGSQGTNDPLAFHAFDLLEIDGKDISQQPNIERKERLEALLASAAPPIYVADHVIGNGERLYRAMCDAGQEGIICKKIDAAYRSARTRQWLKVKCTLRQEFVLVGWKKSSAKGRPFASLLLAQYEHGTLQYRGNVGTGFGADTMMDLARKMAPLRRKTPAIEVDRAASRGVTWLEPRLVAEIAFSEFTADGNVRHGSFVGLRTDKPAKEIVPEKPSSVPDKEGPSIRITNRDRVIFPESGRTKGELADYYAAIAPLMLPHANHRPLSLVRCPQGRSKKCFFQKHDSGSFGQHVRHLPIAEKDGGVEDYLFVKDAEGLLACVQMGTIEFHGWVTRSEDVERPDRLIFDLDPDDGMDFDLVKSAAAEIRARLADVGLVSFAMLSGGKGVHVLVPLAPGHDWDTHKDFAKRFATALSLAKPERFVSTMSKAKRKGRIFIDWLRNQRGSTAVLPYSARARPGAPIAVPLGWDELREARAANIMKITDVKELLKPSRIEALKGWGFAAQHLPDLSLQTVRTSGVECGQLDFPTADSSRTRTIAPLPRPVAPAISPDE